MGEEITKSSEQLGGENSPQTEPDKRGSGSNTRTKTRNTGTTGTGKSGTDKSGTAPEVKERESERPLELVQVENAVPVPEKPVTKKRTRRKKTVKKEPAFSSEQISGLIMAVSTILSSRPDLAVFALTEVEAEQLATPIANILVSSGCGETVGKYADHIALVTTALMIFAPRIMIFIQQQNAKKIEKNGGLKLERAKTKDTRNTSSDNKSSSSPKQIDDNGVLSSIPVLA